ncbi:MAG: hypothetical protein ACI8S6_000933 [Myxococcota bacterium]|jgi:hypothetical protein
MPPLIQSLPDGPLDVIGDIHGEPGALRRLLRRLGADPDRCTVERPLIFVGDLIDRGPDSPGVVALVQRLVEAGVAHCIAGNHELNLLRGLSKEGNGWARGDETDHYQLKQPGGRIEEIPFRAVMASPAEVESILAFFRTLPLALERPDLRVVHACWKAEAIAALPGQGELAELTARFTRDIDAQLQQQDLIAGDKAERAAFADLRRLDVRPDRMLPAHQAVVAGRQSGNPVKVLTSGLEVPVPLEDIFFTGGRWRFVRRDDWWNQYDDGPAVVVGHYWRRRDDAQVDGKPDAWQTARSEDWAGPRGNVMCIDYSVGRRFLERHLSGANGGFDGALAALRWPERVLVFDDRDLPVPTTRWGG